MYLSARARVILSRSNDRFLRRWRRRSNSEFVAGPRSPDRRQHVVVDSVLVVDRIYTYSYDAYQSARAPVRVYRVYAVLRRWCWSYETEQTRPSGPGNQTFPISSAKVFEFHSDSVVTCGNARSRRAINNVSTHGRFHLQNTTYRYLSLRKL